MIRTLVYSCVEHICAHGWTIAAGFLRSLPASPQIRAVWIRNLRVALEEFGSTGACLVHVLVLDWLP